MEVDKIKKCKLAIDGHVLLESEKTGIGQTAQHLIDELVKNSNFDIQLNFVDFLGRHGRIIRKRYKKLGCRIKFCWWLPYRVYTAVTETLGIPYSLLFGKKNDITLFLDYRVPHGVNTKVANYVYDVNYKVYPETASDATLKWLEEMMPLYCERTDTVITISEFSKKEIKKYLGIDDSRIHVVYCGVDCSKYNMHQDIELINAVKNKYGIIGSYLLYLGTLEPRKNIGLLIEAYASLAGEKDSLPVLVIAGKKGWKYEQMFQMVSELGLSDKVIFTGYVDDGDSPALMAGAELFVFPAKYEGFGIPPLEAMACGTPVVVSDAEALLEAAGGCAMVFHSGDAADLKEKIGYALESRAVCERMSASGIEWAEAHTWEKSGERLAAVLKAAAEDV